MHSSRQPWAVHKKKLQTAEERTVQPERRLKNKKYSTKNYQTHLVEENVFNC